MSRIPEIQNHQGARRVSTKYPQNEYKERDNKDQGNEILNMNKEN